YKEDPFFRSVLSKLTEYADFREERGLVYKHMGDAEVLCIPDISVNERRTREVIITHVHSLLAHLGHKKTLQVLREEVWW
ncbi:hypothetical protein M378DRAFT_35238, partial [Amanita muscaria Koide BX008]